jgi:CBS-domain-containing membrane protein
MRTPVAPTTNPKLTRAPPRAPPKSKPVDDTVLSIARPILTIVDRAMTVDELAVFLLEHQVSCAAVMGPAETVVGFVSMTDLVREHVLEGHTGEGGPRRALRSGLHLVVSAHTLVRDIMMPFVLTIPPQSTISSAAAMMAARDVHQLVVRSDAGNVVGVVHARDVLRWLAASRGVITPDDEQTSWRRNCLFAL